MHFSVLLPRRFFIFILLTVIPVSSFTQNLFPPNEPVFIDTEVPRIDISISPTDLQLLLTPGNEYNNTEYPVTFIFKSSIVTDTVFNVGIRLRGNSSRMVGKKSFKISFNSFIKGQKFYELEKLNLNGEHNDPSIVRSKLSWDLMMKAGIPAPRSNHVELYINGHYKGLYINVEHIDEQFVKSRFGNNDGNLYKCLWPADMVYRGADPNLYKFQTVGRRDYALKTNLTEDDYSDLSNLIDIINNSPYATFPEKLGKVFNVNNFLKYLAIEALISNWDGYSYNKNNFYLYHNQQTDKFEFIPYDLDNTFGIDWFGIDWGTRDIYTWSNEWENRPLTKRVLFVKSFKDGYSYFVKKYLVQFFNNETLDPILSTIKDKIYQFAANDTYRDIDYGWSMENFSSSYTQSLGDHVKYGLLPYIYTRNSSANIQLVVNEIPPIISNVTYKDIVYTQPVVISACIDDEDIDPLVRLYYKIDGSGDFEIPMTCTQDNIYSVELPIINDYGNVDFFITATDNLGKTTREPISGTYRIGLSNSETCRLYINEIMSNNNSTIKDDHGEYCDWIELYNPGPDNIWLGDKYLSDNLNNFDKWQMPDTTIKAGEFMIFWADTAVDQGKMHTSFKLSANGEEVGLFESKNNSYAMIDGFSFIKADDDFSIGRYPDGLGVATILSKPTPGKSNIYGGFIDPENVPGINVSPNPFSKQVSISFTTSLRNTIVIYITSLSGEIMMSREFQPVDGEVTYVWDAHAMGMAAGVYILRVQIISAGEQPFYMHPKKLVYLPENSPN